MLLVENILTEARKRLVTVEDSAPLLEAARLLSEPQVSLIIVCDKAGTALGVLSKADIVKRIGYYGGHECKMAATNVMTRTMIACAPGDRLRDVWSTMKSTRFRKIPILDEASKPLGIIYAIDALQALLKEAQDEEQLVFDYAMCVGYH